MAAITINVDAKDKETFTKVCSSLGLNITSAINAFIKATNRRNGIPFELNANDSAFYSEENIAHILAAVERLKSNNGKTLSFDQLESYGKA